MKHKGPACRQAGFTLIELLVTMGIIAVLTGMAIFNFNQSRMRARDVQRKNDLGQLMKALELFKIDNRTYPDAVDFQGTLLGGGYTKVTFVDPKGTNWDSYVYTYTSASKTYSITACLENKADSTRVIPSLSCHSGDGVIYQVTNP